MCVCVILASRHLERSLEKGMATHLAGESHRQKSLEGYSPWGLKESDMTERITHTHTHTETHTHRPKLSPEMQSNKDLIRKFFRKT